MSDARYDVQQEQYKSAIRETTRHENEVANRRILWQSPCGAPINLRALTWYKEAEGIIEEWAGQLVQIANRRPGEIVKDSSPFTLKPW